MRILLLIVAVGFGVRVAYVALAKSGPCRIAINGEVVATSPSECAQGDQIFYNAEANTVAAGRGFVEPLWSVTHPGEKPPPAADHPPLTVLVLAPVSWLSDHRPLSWIVHEPLHDHMREHRYTMVLLGTLVVFLVGLLGRRVGRYGAGGDGVGLVAAGIAAVSPNLWVNDGLVMSETITVLTVVGALLAAFWFRDRPAWPRAAALGALCGLAALARAELILFVPLLAVVVVCTVRSPWAARRGFAAAALVAGLLVIAPWAVFNVARFEDATFLSTNDGLTLLGANCDPVYHGASIGLWSQDAARGCSLSPRPPGDQSQVDHEYRRVAVEYIRHHVSDLPLVVAARIGRTWSLYRPFDMVGYNVGEGRERWVTRAGIFVFYPTLVAAIGGAVVLWRRRLRAALYILAVPAVVVTLSAAATYGQTRFRAVAEPSLALLAAVGTVALWQWHRRAPGNAEAEGSPEGTDSMHDRPLDAEHLETPL